MDRRNHTINVLKFIFSLCIIGVHVHLFEDVNIRAYKLLTQSLFRIGVPFYFIVSGWYYAGKLNQKEKAHAWLMRLVKIYIGFEILDIILNIMIARIPPLSLLLLRICTTGVNQIYWYLISLILTCVLCSSFWRRGYTKALIFAGMILYLLTMTYDAYSFLFQNTVFETLGRLHTFIWRWPQAGFGESVLFLSIGVYLRQNKIEQKSPLPFLISVFALVVEGFLCQRYQPADTNCYFSLIPASIFLFLLARAYPDALRLKYADEMSLYVYMIHIYLTYISVMFSSSTVIRFLITSALASLISFLIVRFRK